MTHQALSETPDFRVLFESAPALLMVLAPDSHFTILAATDAYLRATLTRRDEVVGRALFEVFPDNIEDADANGTAGLRASLERVLRDGVSDTMSAQKHDMRQSQDEGGGIEERCWAPTNTPVLAADGTCRYIIHRAEDVAGFLRSQNERLKLLQ